MRKRIILLLKFGLFLWLVLSLAGVWDIAQLFHRSPYRTFYAYYTEVLSAIVIFLLLLDFLQYFWLWYYRKRHHVDSNDLFIIGIRNIYSLVLTITIVVGILLLFQVDLLHLLTSLSIIFAGIAILTKEFITNMISGMLIAFSGQLRTGDHVRIGQLKGRIINITLQNIHLQTFEEDVIYVPNNSILNAEVVNYTQNEIKRTAIDFDLELQYLPSVEEMEQELIQAIQQYNSLIVGGSHYLRIATLHKDYASLKFQYILKTPNRELERQIRKTVLRFVIQRRNRLDADPG